MEVTMLRDKLNTGMRVMLDNLSIKELVRIKFLIESGLKERQEFWDSLESDDDRKVFSDTKETIEIYKSMLSAMENEKTIQLDCYRSYTEQESFATIVKKYKKIR